MAKSLHFNNTGTFRISAATPLPVSDALTAL
jgi:hypothetical protein